MTHAFSRLRPLFAQRAELNAQLVGRLNETLGGIRVVKAYRGEPHEQQLFTEGAHQLLQSVVRELTTSASVGALAIVNLGVLSAVLVYLGGRNIIAGTMTLGDFVMFVFFIGLLLAPMVRLAETGTQLSETLAGLDRMREIRRLRTESEEDQGREPLPELHGEVAFDDVTFEYSPGVPVVHGISFRAPAGTTTALVGPSGAGKSTAINLVMGFETPVSGRVIVDGRDLARVRRSDYRAHLGVVLQETFLFDGTIAENIAYARKAATHEEIRA